MSWDSWLWRLALRNLRRNQRRNLMIGSAVAAAYAGILLFTGYVVWVEKYLRSNIVYVNQTGHIVIARSGSIERQISKPQGALIDKEQQGLLNKILSQDAAVAFVGQGLKAYVMAIKNCQSRGVLALGRDADVDQKVLRHPDPLHWNQELLHPATLRASEALHLRMPNLLALIPTPILNRQLAIPSQADCGVRGGSDDVLQIMAKTYAGYTAVLEGSVVGEQSTGLALLDERSLFVRTKDLQRLLETDQVGYISVYAHSLLDVPGLYWRLTHALQNLEPKLDVIPFIDESVGLYYTGSIGFLAAVACFFVLLVTAVVALALVSLYLMTFAERSLEIGVLLSMGFHPRKVASLFEAEALLLTFLSLAIGLVSALGIGEVIYSQNFRFSPPGIAGDTRFRVAWEPWVMGVIGLCFLLTIFICVRIIARIKSKQSALSLLQSSSTL